MKKIIAVVAIACMFLSSCIKYAAPETSVDPEYSEPNFHLTNDTILIDASRDGGVWWAPQTDPVNSLFDHQGRALQDYLFSLGYIAEELPRGETITRDLLKRYQLVIRAGFYGAYTADEIAAYQEFLNRHSALLLASDHSAQLQNDQLATLLGLKFEGNYTTNITQFKSHPITQGVTSHPYIAGSVIRNPDPNKITTLGYYSDNNITNAAAMGIVKHPTSRIFFIGDVNGLETVPRPFVQNLLKWLKQ